MEEKVLQFLSVYQIIFCNWTPGYTLAI